MGESYGRDVAGRAHQPPAQRPPAPNGAATVHDLIATNMVSLSKTDSPLLEVRDVSRHFGGLSAVSDFSLQLCRGDLTGLIGPNGAGKTTCFNLITGIYKPSAGQIIACGQRIDGLSPAAINRAGIARTFQNIRLFKNLTVLDNVMVGLQPPEKAALFAPCSEPPASRASAREAEADAMLLLETLNLAGKAHDAASSLPYGDQRRLEIARGAGHRPARYCCLTNLPRG